MSWEVLNASNRMSLSRNVDLVEAAALENQIKQT